MTGQTISHHRVLDYTITSTEVDIWLLTLP